MAVLQRGGQNLPFPCVCYPQDPMSNRVKARELQKAPDITLNLVTFLKKVLEVKNSTKSVNVAKNYNCYQF